MGYDLNNFFFFFFFLPRRTACGILVPRPGIEPMNNFLRTVWWIEYVLLLDLAPQGVTLEYVQLFYISRSLPLTV